MGGLLGKAKRFASSRQGRKAMDQASSYARSPKGKRQIASVRQRLLGGRGGRPR
jgi:hypothetical protein